MHIFSCNIIASLLSLNLTGIFFYTNLIKICKKLKIGRGKYYPEMNLYAFSLRIYFVAFYCEQCQLLYNIVNKTI